MSVFVRVDSQQDLDKYLDTDHSYFSYLPPNNNFIKVVEVFPNGDKQKLAAVYNTRFVISVTGSAFKSFKDKERELEESVY